MISFSDTFGPRHSDIVTVTMTTDPGLVSVAMDCPYLNDKSQTHFTDFSDKSLTPTLSFSDKRHKDFEEFIENSRSV